eukprot:TRINITY_DN894_c0_g3_i1.p1 TRINITY_DN894_c0_g3~~TRINITY_DN894_c0_g3_i1.p1  ORF type:complete len:699 (+),score=119.47 TRINITY_DN894_c0_g3_i1:61-2097(+)
MDSMEVDTVHNGAGTNGTGFLPIEHFAVHRGSFVEWQPEGVVALAFHPSNNKLAVGRENGDIEIWSCANLPWYQEGKIPGASPSVLRCIVWVGDRLISTGLQGKLIEWSLETLTEIRSVDSSGGPVWGISLSPDGKTLAAACDDGSVRFFDVSEGRLTYVKGFARKGRLLCLAWHPSGKFLFTGGSDGTVRKWDDNGKNIAIMAHANTNQQRLLWSIAVLKDMTVITGDSLGTVTFYDGELGTMIQNFPFHLGDVLAIAVSPEEKMIVTSGVDYKLGVFRTTIEQGLAKWFAKTEGGRYHTHDIKALVFSDQNLVSGGVDASVNVYNLNLKHLQKLSSFPQKPSVSLSREKRVILCQHYKKLELWRLGETHSDSLESLSADAPLDIMKPYKFLLELKPKGQNITVSTLSPDGQYVACSDRLTTKLFRLTYAEDGEDERIAEVKKVKLPVTTASYAMAFTADSTRLIITTTEYNIHVVTLSANGEVEEAATAHFFKEGKATSSQPKSPLTFLEVNPKGDYLACATNNTIKIYRVNGIELVAVLPSLDSSILTFGFCLEATLMLITSSRSVYWYNVKKQKLEEDKKRRYNVRDIRSNTIGMQQHPTRPDVMIFWGESFFTLVVVNAQHVAEDTRYSFVRRYEPVLLVDFVSPRELVVIERPWVKVLEKMPDTLYRHRYIH